MLTPICPVCLLPASLGVCSGMDIALVQLEPVLKIKIKTKMC